MDFKWTYPECSRFDQRGVDAIMKAALNVLSKVTWTIDGTPEFMEPLSDYGCRVDGKKVSFEKKVIDQAMAAMQQTRQENVDNADRDTEVPERVTFSTSGQALLCVDPYTSKVRPATKKDLADLSRVINTFPGLERTHPTFIPQDAPLRTQELHAYVGIMLSSDKPYRVSCYSPEIVKYFLEANIIYYGSRDEAIENLLLPCKVWVNTPFMISRESIEAALIARELTGKPLVFGSMPVVGIATPVTPAGALTLITAEVIGMNIMSLAVDGRVCGWCADPLSLDMKTGVHNQWGPETIILGTAQSHMASRLFGGKLSVRATTGTAAKVPGAQSMAERAFGMGLGFLAGARRFGGFAALAHSDVGSIVQLMLDMELASVVSKLAEGFQVNEEEIAEELITDLAEKGAAFLDADHTVEYFRKYQWFPELMDRRVPGAWAEDPKTMVDNAREKAMRLIETAPNKCPLDKNQKQELQELLESADNELT